MKRLNVLAATLLVLTAIFSPVGMALADSHESATGSSEFTIEDFRKGGTTIEDTDPSTRWLGQVGRVYVSYEETNKIKMLGKTEKSFGVDHVVAPGSLVDTNEVTMHVSRERDAPTKKVHVVTVYAERETRTVTKGNTTTTEAYAANVTKDVKEVTLEGAFDKIPVTLRNHPDEKHMALMYIEEYPDARWSFDHHSIATTTELPFGDSWGSFFPWFLKTFLVLTLIGGAGAVALASKTLDRTKAGPGKGMPYYFITGGMLVYGALYFQYNSVLEWLVGAPYVMGLSVVGVVYVAALNHMDETKTGTVERLLTVDVSDPLGNEVPDIEFEEGEDIHFVEEEGVVSIIKKGSLQQFLVRLVGGQPAQIDISDFKSRVRYEGPRDEKFYAAPGPDKVIDITYPSLEFSTDVFKTTKEVVADGGDDASTHTKEAWDRSALSSGFLGLAFGSLVGTSIFGMSPLGYLVGFVPILYKMKTMHDGSVEFVPAADHSTPAKARVINEQQTYAVFETFGDLKDAAARADTDAIRKGAELGEAYIERAREDIDNILGGGGNAVKSGMNSGVADDD